MISLTYACLPEKGLLSGKFLHPWIIAISKVLFAPKVWSQHHHINHNDISHVFVRTRRERRKDREKEGKRKGEGEKKERRKRGCMLETGCKTTRVRRDR